MEPRPSRPSRATGPSSTKSTRTPWTPSPTVEPTAPPRTADIYSAPQGQSGSQWYGQPGTYAPDQTDYRQTGPMTPIKPRGERGNKLLRYLLAALLLIAVVGGGAYAITQILADDDSPEDPTVVAGAQGTVTPTQAATQAPEDQAGQPTATTAPAAPTEAPPPAADATEPAADESVDAAAGTEPTAPASDGEDIAASESAAAFLPEPSALVGDWSVSTEGERNKAEVADAIGTDGDALLTSWRWRENFYLDLNRNDAADAPDDASFVSVSVHRFANAEGASEALTALSDIVVAAQGLQDVETPAIGDQARGLAGPSEGANLYVLYVQDGKYLIRLGGSSATGDPAPTINALAEEILTGAGDQTA